MSDKILNSIQLATGDGRDEWSATRVQRCGRRWFKPPFGAGHLTSQVVAGRAHLPGDEVHQQSVHAVL